MRWFPRSFVIMSLFSIVASQSACVPLSEHNKLKSQFQRQEGYIKRHKGDVARASRETTRLSMELRSKEFTIQRLENENKDLKHKLTVVVKETPSAPAPASYSKAPSAQAAPQPAGAKTQRAQATQISGFQVNPETNGIVLDQGVLFSPGSARLKTTGKRALQKLAQSLNSPKYVSYKVRVEGHTDSSPITRSKSVKDNWQLSGMRARSVLNYLEARGVNPSRLSFAGYSFHKPIKPGSSRSAKAKNRRVEVLLFD